MKEKNTNSFLVLYHQVLNITADIEILKYSESPMVYLYFSKQYSDLISLYSVYFPDQPCANGSISSSSTCSSQLTSSIDSGHVVSSSPDLITPIEPAHVLTNQNEKKPSIGLDHLYEAEEAIDSSVPLKSSHKETIESILKFESQINAYYSYFFKIFGHCDRLKAMHQLYIDCKIVEKYIELFFCECHFEKVQIHYLLYHFPDTIFTKLESLLQGEVELGYFNELKDRLSCDISNINDRSVTLLSLLRFVHVLHQKSIADLLEKKK